MNVRGYSFAFSVCCKRKRKKAATDGWRLFFAYILRFCSLEVHVVKGITEVLRLVLGLRVKILFVSFLTEVTRHTVA